MPIRPGSKAGVGTAAGAEAGTVGGELKLEGLLRLEEPENVAADAGAASEPNPRTTATTAIFLNGGMATIKVITSKINNKVTKLEQLSLTCGQ